MFYVTPVSRQNSCKTFIRKGTSCRELYRKWKTRAKDT